MRAGGRAMTEAEWLACDEPGPMLDWLENRPPWGAPVDPKRTIIILRGQKSPGGERPPPSARKMRLLLVGCSRLVWDQIPPGELRETVLTAERYADGHAAPEDLSRTRDRYYSLGGEMGGPNDGHDSLVLRLAFAAAYPNDRIVQPRFGTTWWGVQQLAGRYIPTLIREIFGNPFRRVAADTSWLTSTAVALASQMYESRDFGAMPILADALQDAGCDSDDILDHCRGPGQHVRGCWVVDLILGKS